MEDKKKHKKEKKEKPTKKQPPRQQPEPIKDIDDLIFEGEIVKLHSEK